MSILTRTEIVSLAAGSTAAATLAGASALHALWGTGSSWPLSSQDELADLVVGRRPMPGPAACTAVAAVLAVAAAATAGASYGGLGRFTHHSRRVTAVVSASLLARGAGGIAADLVDKVDATPPFRKWNRRLYNPLCITLALLVAVGRRSRP